MPGWLVLSELVLFFGGLLAVIGWQYHDLNKRARARRDTAGTSGPPSPRG